MPSSLMTVPLLSALLPVYFFPPASVIVGSVPSLTNGGTFPEAAFPSLHGLCVLQSLYAVFGQRRETLLLACPTLGGPGHCGRSEWPVRMGRLIQPGKTQTITCIQPCQS